MEGIATSWRVTRRPNVPASPNPVDERPDAPVFTAATVEALPVELEN